MPWVWQAWDELADLEALAKKWGKERRRNQQAARIRADAKIKHEAKPAPAAVVGLTGPHTAPGS